MPSFDLNAAAEVHYGRIHRAALVMTGNPWDADDLAQNGPLHAARAADRYEGRAAEYTWLYAILLNRERRWRRRKQNWWRRLQEVFSSRPNDPGTSEAADRSLEVHEWRHGLWGRVARLPDAQRYTLVLRYSEGLAYEEIAVILQCPVGTAKSRVHNGLKTLGELLRGTEYDGAAGVSPPSIGDGWHALTVGKGVARCENED